MLTMEAHSAAAAAARFSVASIHSSTSFLSHSSALFIPRIYRRFAGRLKSANGYRAFGSEPAPVKPDAKAQWYHPLEEISEPRFFKNGEAKLTRAEISRTIIEVNSKATLMFSGLIDEEFRDDIFWPDLPYVTDEHGNIYVRVKTDEDILKTLTSEEIVVVRTIVMYTYHE
ncbi:Pentatricopeptide repeat (PPR) superfamily protein [Striga hermonthica]|uniref:Pentatricopeptide repeat (PPR) superfamily protein n=1 Tax=Striga hermonthica TaxID=68872 RepID=A0A9N7N516_STRHE|nr:Pentatricopeptide repeat (PPR) superfamily protein [Striga hermonthica]